MAGKEEQFPVEEAMGRISDLRRAGGRVAAQQVRPRQPAHLRRPAGPSITLPAAPPALHQRLDWRPCEHLTGGSTGNVRTSTDGERGGGRWRLDGGGWATWGVRPP